MSIRDEIRARESEERLCRIVPGLPGQPEPRVIFVSDGLFGEIMGPHGSPVVSRRMARVHADLDHFITGGRIIVGGVNDKHAYLKPLVPQSEEVWEIRCIDPKPSFRLFGRFAEQDVFIGTHMELRTHLGGPESLEWKEAIRLCKAKWRALFPTYQPLTGGEVRDYISGNVFDLRSLRQGSP